MSKYKPLADFLASQAANEVRLRFDQIEEIIGAPLPPSAFNHEAWWSNSRTDDSHTWAHQWLRAGWAKMALNRLGRWVVFQRFEVYSLGDQRAMEGYEFDAKVVLRTRNRDLAAKCRERDHFTCQCCGFRLEHEGSYVIEVHHLEPLGLTAERETKLDKLVCLCPTCHRIAHLRSIPYAPAEVKLIRAAGTAA